MKMELERYITIYNETKNNKKRVGRIQFFGFLVLLFWGKKITKRRQVEEKHGTNQSGTPI